MATMRTIHGYRKSKTDDAKQAKRYLGRYQRYLNYTDLKSNQLPIGSGVVESACKQIVTERIKQVLLSHRWPQSLWKKHSWTDCLSLARHLRSQKVPSKERIDPDQQTLFTAEEYPSGTLRRRLPCR